MSRSRLSGIALGAKKMRITTLAVIAAFLGVLQCLAEPTPKFVVVTADKLGFKEGPGFYSLGMKLSEFKSKFGPSEKAKADESGRGYLANTITHYYVNDGLMVTVKTNGTIIGFIFYVIPSDTLRAASVATDTGISAGASVREIVKRYGNPYKRDEFTLDEFEQLKLYYKYGEAVLAFNFDHGVLRSISMHAEYLPYLEK